MEKIQIYSPAKINLYLDVISKRDDGYHNLEMIMQKIALFDTLTIEKAQGISITCNDEKIPTDSRNIVYKATELIAGDYPQVSGARIHIEKQIPSEAGLAGGSSNGASAIIALSHIYNLNLTREEMCHYGEKLGSDVNFFFFGPTCHVSGRGEIIKELPSLPALPIVLLKPEAGLSAGEVYKNLNLQNQVVNENQKKPVDIEKILESVACEDIPFILNNLYNKLEESSFKLNSDLEKIKNEMIKENPYSLMSGSGTTFFSLFKDNHEAQNFYKKFQDKFYFSALTTLLK